MKTDFFQVQGVIKKQMRNKFYLIKCNNDKEIVCNVASRFRSPTGRRKAKIVIGDKVIVEISLGDLEKGQIVGLKE
jgi:translation initiation factor IF-1